MMNTLLQTNNLSYHLHNAALPNGMYCDDIQSLKASALYDTHTSSV